MQAAPLPTPPMGKLSSPVDDMFARTQKIIEAAMAVQKSAGGPTPPLSAFALAPGIFSNMDMNKMRDMKAKLVPSATFAVASSAKPRKPRKTTTKKRKPQPEEPSAATAAVTPQPQTVVEPPSPSRVMPRRKSAVAGLQVIREATGIGASAAVGPPRKKSKKAGPSISEPLESNQSPAPSMKKKSSKKAPKPVKKAISSALEAEKPKRPLSAYNLFFRHERAVILMAEVKCSSSTSIEGLSASVSVNRLPNQTAAEKEREIKSLLVDNPFHQDRKKRAHRKTHGKIGFTDLVKLIASRWKEADEETKTTFESLAIDDKKRHRIQHEAWLARVAAEAELTPHAAQGNKRPLAVPGPYPVTPLPSVVPSDASAPPHVVSPFPYSDDEILSDDVLSDDILSENVLSEEMSEDDLSKESLDELFNQSHDTMPRLSTSSVPVDAITDDVILEDFLWEFDNAVEAL